MDLAELKIRIDTLEARLAQQDLDKLAQKGRETERSISTMAKGIAASLAALGIGVAVNKAVREFSALNQGLIGVRKTTGIAGQELERFGRRIQEMTLQKDVGGTAEELLAIAQAAGQLGVAGEQDLLKFTKTIAQLGSASDLKGEDAATTLSRLLTVTGEAAGEVDVLGSVIVRLGNNMAATEREIALMATEVGQATSAYSVSSAEASALGAAMRSMGVRAELGGSTVGRAFRTIEAAIVAGGENMQRLAALTGMTGEQLRQTFEDDSVRVFQAFVEGLGEAIKSGRSAQEVLGEFGLKGEEVLKVLPTMATRSEQLAYALSLANDELQNTTALQDEAAAAGESFSAALGRGQAAASIIATTLGQELSGPLGEVVDGFTDWVEKNDEFLRQDVAGSIKQIAEVMTTASRNTSGLTEAFQGLVYVFKVIATAAKVVWIALDRTAAGIAKVAWAATLVKRGEYAQAMEVLKGHATGWVSDMSEDIGSLADIWRTNTESVHEYTAAIDKTARHPSLSVMGAIDKKAAAAMRANDERNAGGGGGGSTLTPSGGSVSSARRRADELAGIQQDLTDKINELTMSEYDYKRFTIEKEIEDIKSRDSYLRASAEQREAIDTQLAEYRILKMIEVAEAEQEHIRESLDLQMGAQDELLDMYKSYGQRRVEEEEKILQRLQDMQKYGTPEQAFDATLAIEFGSYKSELTRSREMAVQAAEGIKGLVDEVGDAFGGFVRDIIEGSVTMEEALANMLDRLADAFMDFAMQMFQTWLTNQLGDIFSSIFSQGSSMASSMGSSSFLSSMNVSWGASFAQGGIFPGGVRGHDGIVTHPTVFPFAHGGAGRFGLMGEAGPEVIMPAVRMSDGHYGVRVQGEDDRHSDSPEQQKAGDVKVVNVFDPSLFEQYAQSSDGERVIVNIMQRNRNVLRG